jgi:hypothetical protein
VPPCTPHMPIAAAAAVAACPSPVGLARPLCGAYPRRRRGFRLEASSSASAPAPAAADEGAGAGPCPVVRFDMDNFAIADRVSVGLHGRVGAGRDPLILPPAC